jgi:hypothetical protein
MSEDPNRVQRPPKTIGKRKESWRKQKNQKKVVKGSPV